MTTRPRPRPDAHDFTLMLMTRDGGVARAAVRAGVDRIFLDLEIAGKAERQRGRNTIISGHTLADLERVRAAVPDAEVLARVNPPSAGTPGEVDAVVRAGADVVMLPYFQSSQQVAAFVAAVAGRARTCLLLETAAAAVRVERIAAVGGVDEIHVGLNDLHASMGLAFMHELLAGGVLDELASRIRAVAPAIRFGFGGGALLDAPHPVPPRDVLREHVRLGSRMIILSRTFTGDATSEAELAARVDLPAEIAKIRQAVAEARARTADETERDRLRIRELIWRVADQAVARA
ncbi:MAG: aldolase [Chloroflexi bacterium]|nr:MAG: aldolase [Chloroflexota bacterium]